MHIRIMQISDYPQSYALWSNTAGMGMRSMDDSYEGIARYLQRNPATSFVAEEDGVILGTILCGHDGRRGYIYHTAVNEAHRGRGIGRALVQSAIDALRSQSILKLAFVVKRENSTGNQFWERLGCVDRPDLVYRNLSLHEENE